MNENLKRHINSAINTFLPIFLTALAIQVQTLDWTAVTWSAIGSLLVAAIRAGWKPLVEYLNLNWVDIFKSLVGPITKLMKNFVNWLVGLFNKKR